MTEPLFFARPKGLTAAEIVALTGAVAPPGAPLERRIRGIAPLEHAGPSDLSFLDKRKFLDRFAATHAGICLTTERFAAQAPARVTVLVTRQPYRAFVAATQALYPDVQRPSSLFEARGIAASALVHPSARLEPGATIDPGAVVGPRAEIGAGSVIAATAVIGPDVRVGRGCMIGAGATITHALVGDRVIVHAGCRIGQDGFGFLPGLGGHGKVPQVGRVIIQDDVEIGANTTIDRGAARDTIIGEGTKIDNLCQIAHNVTIGRNCLIAAQTGISGSVVVEDYVMMGGKVGITDHLTIGAGAMIAAGSGLMSDVPPGAKWGGAPAGPAREWLKGVAALRRLARRSGEPDAAGGEP